MFKRVLALTILATGVLAAPALAEQRLHPRHPRQHAGINAREHRQAARIRDGVRDRELTRAEAARLRAEMAAIRAEERLYRRTGPGLTPRERRDLQRDLNRASRDIRRLKNNRLGSSVAR
jgi:hypothetical protein